MSTWALCCKESDRATAEHDLWLLEVEQTAIPFTWAHDRRCHCTTADSVIRPSSGFAEGFQVHNVLSVHPQTHFTSLVRISCCAGFIYLADALQYSRPDGIPPHHLVLDFAPGQSAYDVAAMESPAEHSSLVEAHERRTAGPAPVTLISCLEARKVAPRTLLYATCDSCVVDHSAPNKMLGGRCPP
jgi:hypothetical protein